MKKISRNRNKISTKFLQILSFKQSSRKFNFNFKEIIKKYNIKSGYYYDFYSNKLELRVDDFHDIRDDSLLICLDKKIAFFFHHDGWIWFCKINDNLINF